MRAIKSVTLTILIGIVAVGLTVSPVRAAVIWAPDGTSVQNVNVAGTLYDVAFGDGSCLDLFSPCNPTGTFAFATLAEATVAALVLQSDVFVDIQGQGDFGTQPWLTNGCDNSGDLGQFLCIATIPYEAQVGRLDNVLFASIRNGTDPSSDGPNACGNFGDCINEINGRTTDTDTWPANWLTYAVFSPSLVPLPAAIWLLGSAIAAIGFTRKRAA